MCISFKEMYCMYTTGIGYSNTFKILRSKCHIWLNNRLDLLIMCTYLTFSTVLPYFNVVEMDRSKMDDDTFDRSRDKKTGLFYLIANGGQSFPAARWRRANYVPSLSSWGEGNKTKRGINSVCEGGGHFLELNVSGRCAHGRLRRFTVCLFAIRVHLQTVLQVESCCSQQSQYTIQRANSWVDLIHHSSYLLTSLHRLTNKKEKKFDGQIVTNTKVAYIVSSDCDLTLLNLANDDNNVFLHTSWYIKYKSWPHQDNI